MESFDSSPNYMKATSSFDAKKDNSPGGSECDDMISLTSSTCGSSSVNGPHTPKLNDNGIKRRSNKSKAAKSFGNVKSFRRRAKSRIVHSPVAIPDEYSLADFSESSPNYLKATSCSRGKKMEFPESSSDKNSSNSLRSKLVSTLSRTSSLRNVRILLRKTSFKPKRSLLNYSKVSEDVAVTRATYSSILKGSKVPEPLDRTRGAESKKSSAMKVCRYHHCSLHGHCQGTHDPVSQTKHFLYKRRRSLRKQKSIMRKTEPEPGFGGAKRFANKRNFFQEIRITSIEEQDKNGMDSYEEVHHKPEVELFGDGYEHIRELDFLEIAFGEMSFPERSYQENLDVSRKYSLSESNGYCSRCPCHKREQVEADGGFSLREYTFSSLDKRYHEISQNGSTDVIKPPNEQISEYIEDSATSSRSNEKSNKEYCPETPAIYDEVTKKNCEFSSSLNSRTSSNVNSEEEGNFTNESMPADTFKGNKVTHVNDSETNAPTQEGGQKLQFSKPRHISMWNLIHQHMTLNLAAEQENKPLEGEYPVDGENSLLAKESINSHRDSSDSEMSTMSNDSENQEIELRKMFAIKLVREAIEKILLPEVQDQTSDDQSVKSESTPRTEILERNQTEAVAEENFAEPDATDKDEGNLSSNPKQETLINDDASNPEIKQHKKDVVKKSEKKAPKHWSNLKKWILLQRFIRELEKVKKFNPKKPHLLPLNPDPEAEKVNLRPLTVDGKKSAEEWMLDYALRQAVGQLAPTQKRKVALLVKAFETVAPTKEDSQVQCKIPRPKSDESVFEGLGKNNDEAPVNRKDVLGSDNSVSVLNSENQESDIKTSMKTGKVCHLSDSYGKLLTPQSSILDGGGNSKATETMADETERETMPKLQVLQENAICDPVEGKTEESGRCIETDRKTRIKMWHMIYQHVVSGIAEKAGSQLLDGSEDDEVEDNSNNISPPINNDDYFNDFPQSANDSNKENNMSSGFTKSDAFKLVKEAVDEILLSENEIQDDSSDTQSVTSESISGVDIFEKNCSEKEEGKRKPELLKSKNWSKLKKLILLKRSIKALEKDRNFNPQSNHLFPQAPNTELEKIDLRRKMMDERKKAEQWMLDYAVQHIVTKLTPARTRRVSMLVEAFEAVVPLPEM